MSNLIYLASKSAKGQKWAKMASKGIKNAIIYRPDFLLKTINMAILIQSSVILVEAIE